MALRSDRLYVNLPVKDLKKSMDYFSEIGFEFDPRFTDENATCMIINDNTFVMLLVEDSFKSFIKQDLPDSTKTAEVIIALAANSREQVDEIVDKAMAAGGKLSNEPMVQDFMYARSFEDIDGHLWEVLFVDISAFSQG